MVVKAHQGALGLKAQWALEVLMVLKAHQGILGLKDRWVLVE